MSDSAFIALVHNAALLLALALVFEMVASRLPLAGSRRNQVLVGLLVGAIGVGIMLAPFRLVTGIVFDTRSVLLAICGLYFGLVPTLVAVLLTAAYRLNLGGPAALTGSAVIVASAALGLLWRRRYRDRLTDLTWRELYLLGLVVHVVMLLILQSLGWSTGREILLMIGLPVVVIYPLATTALGLLLTSRLRKDRTTAALQASEARFAGFFQSNPLPCVISDLATGRIIDVNEAFIEAVGRPQSELVGQSAESLGLWSGGEDRQQILAAIAAGRNAQGLPIRWRRPNGEVREALGFFEVWVEAGSSRLLSSFVDITARKESELAAARAQAELSRVGLALDRLVNSCIYMKDRESRYTYANRTTLELFGVTLEELRGQDDTRFFSPETALRLQAIDRRVMDEGAENNEEVEVQLRDGSTRYYLEIKTPIFAEGPERQVVGVCGISTDVTERMQAEEAVRASEQRYRSLFENEHTAMLVFDPATEAILEANPAAVAFYGWSRGDLQGRRLGEIVPALRTTTARSWSVGSQLTAPHRRADGTTREVEMFSGPMTVGGRALAYVIIHDITERRLAEQRMAEAQEESARLLAESTHSRQALLSLVEDLREADQRLKREQELAQSTLDALQAHICVVDEASVIIAVNRAWREFGVANGAPADTVWIGQNYLRACGESSGPGSSDGAEFALRLKAVLAGEAAALEMEYPCDSPSESRWFLARITRFAGRGALRVVIAHEDITARKLAEQAVRESEERWRSAVQGSAAGIWANDFITGTAFYSDRSKEILGFGPDEISQRMDDWVTRIHPDDVEIGRRAIAEHLAGRKPFYEAEHRFRCKDGTYKWIQSRGRASFDASGKLTRVVGTHVDIHERKLAEERLRESSEFLDNLFHSASAPIVVWDPLFRITRFNRAFEQLTGRRAEDVLGRDLPVLFPPDRVGELMALLRPTLEGEPWQGVEMPIQHVDGSVRLVLWNSATLLGADGRTPVATIVQGQDITERKQTELLLRTSLREKEALLKEVHHRVKNNLQVITSLLRLEVARNPESGTVGVLREMQGRIRSMALLHETLYRSGNLEQVDLAVYLERVAGQTFRAQNEGKPNVRLRLELTWCPVSIDQAIPCGLIVNELVSNCLKHAFPARRGGEIAISLRPADLKGHVQIAVADDGPGLPADFATRRQGSLGVQLVEDLARQLEGTLEVGRAAGASFTVTFPLDTGARREPGQQ